MNARNATLLLGLVIFASRSFAEGEIPRGIEKRQVLRVHREDINSLAFSADGKLLATAGGYNDSGFGYAYVFIWDVSTEKKVFALPMASIFIREKIPLLEFVSDSELLVGSIHSGSVWSFRENKQTWIFWFNGEIPIKFYFGRNRIVTWRRDKKDETKEFVTIRDLNGTKLEEIEKHHNDWFDEQTPKLTLDENLECLAFSKDHRLCFSKARDARSKVSDVETGKVKFEYGDDRDTVDAAAFSPDSTLLATGYSKIRIWDLKNDKLLAEFDPHERPVRALAFSPDGKLLASGAFDEPVFIWDISKLTNPPKP